MGRNSSVTSAIATFGNGVVIVAAFPQAGVTAPIVRDAVGLFVGIQWDGKELPELYTRASMAQAKLHMGRGLP
jgi:hypothetical protein